MGFVTILAQQKSSLWEKSKALIFRRKCTDFNKSGNQVLKLSLHPPLLSGAWKSLSGFLGTTSYALGSGGFNLGFEM